MHSLTKKTMFSIIIGMFLLSACHIPARGIEQPSELEQLYAQINETLTHLEENNRTATATEIPQPTSEDMDALNEPLTIYLHPGLPESLKKIDNQNQYPETEFEEEASIRVLVGPSDSVDQENIRSDWIYTLAAPFYTITDDMNFEDLSKLWRGEVRAINQFSKIYVTASTSAAIRTVLGTPDESMVEVISKQEFDEIPLDDNESLMILPFEDLTKNWKVIRVDQQAPIDIDFNPQNYPLKAAIWIETQLETHDIQMPESNYNPDNRTVLIMTGVTALTRATAYRMEIEGNQYPGRDIREWLTSADLTHISNEVPFAANCPPPDPVQENLIFCSSPERIELLEYVGADIIELTGNHLLDYGLTAINLTLDMYDQREWLTYAGGRDQVDARSPALITHNGNKLAFIGCNTVGPPNAWAAETKPGAAACDNFQWMVNEIERLKDNGYLPIVTFQYAEDYTAYPSTQMVSDFQMMADAGAVIVNGSQAHTPKIMTFYGTSFLHFGLGNLFFDQMEVYYNDVYLSGTRQEFIDRLVFYDGQLISIELLTAMLEDYARPRPMTSVEREDFLSRIFSVQSDINQ